MNTKSTEGTLEPGNSIQEKSGNMSKIFTHINRRISELLEQRGENDHFSNMVTYGAGGIAVSLLLSSVIYNRFIDSGTDEITTVSISLECGEKFSQISTETSERILVAIISGECAIVKK